MEQYKASQDTVKKSKILELSPISINMVSLILLLNSFAVLTFIIWQQFLGYGSTQDYRAAIFSLVDIYFAYNLFKRKNWARKFVIVRSIIGCIIWTVTDLLSYNIFGAIIQVVFFGAVVLLLTVRMSKVKVKILGIGAIALLFYICYQNTTEIFHSQNIIKQVNALGLDKYTSERYNYRINVDDGWKIMPRSNFEQIDKSFYGTDAEVIIVADNGKGYCMIIPEELDGYGVEYGLDDLRNVILEEARNLPAVQILENKPIFTHGDAGFEIQYSIWTEGFQYKYLILYSIYERTGIQLLGWCLNSDADKIFPDVRDIFDKITVIK